MRRDKLDRAIKRIHYKVPRFFRRCSQCEDDVKGEQMWYFTTWWGISVIRETTWTCRRCAPLMSDLFKAHPNVFKDLDLSPIIEEEQLYRMVPHKEEATDADV